MNKSTQPVLSVVVPFFNEAPNLPHLYESLKPVLESLQTPYEIILVNDGSTDGGGDTVSKLCAHDDSVKLLSLSRNFGKEIATTAGIHKSVGQAVMMLDADGQHPVDAIPAFFQAWQAGAKVVIGRRQNRHASLSKRLGSTLFYSLFRRLTGIRTDLEANDFRLIDAEVRTRFNSMTEHNRIARGLIDWLGYEHVYIKYRENARYAGDSVYSLRKLFKLAIDSAISHSISPLYISAYIGAVVLPISTLLGLGMLANALLGDPLNLNITGSGYLMVLVLFLVGILLISQGIIGLYLSHIHAETQNRPLYIIDEARTQGWS